MDSIYYVGIVLVVGVLLLLLRGKKPEERESAKSSASTSARASSSAPKSTEAAQPAAPASDDSPPDSESTAQPSAAPSEAAPTRQADIPGLRKGLARSRGEDGVFGRLKAMFVGRTEIGADIAEAIEEVLLTSDVGNVTTTALLERIRDGLSSGSLNSEEAVWQALREETLRVLDVDGAPSGLNLKHKPTVVLMVGVNGAGKTTTIGKLATQLQAQGKVCILAAGDTFRAAAVQQLVVWGERIGCEVVKGADGADPASVVFDAVKRAQETGADVVLADTAGRLHTKSNLMSEMQKIERTLAKSMAGAPHEVLLVIDGTTGQNAMAQAKEFKEALGLTGIVLTKLDGTAKGGFVLGISDSLKLPVRFVGLGERPNDLHEFVAEEFVEALLGHDA